MAAITAPTAISRPGCTARARSRPYAAGRVQRARILERVLERHRARSPPWCWSRSCIPAWSCRPFRVPRPGPRGRAPPGALFVLDDCLMFRLAPGGSAEKFGLSPDIIFLGKFIGGGMPAGAVGAAPRSWTWRIPRGARRPLSRRLVQRQCAGSVAGRITVEHLTTRSIDAHGSPGRAAEAGAGGEGQDAGTLPLCPQ